MKLLISLLLLCNILRVSSQKKDCELEKTTDFNQFKAIYNNTVQNDFKDNLLNAYSENDIEVILFKKPDRFSGELTSVVIKNDRIFGFKKDTLKVSYINVGRKDSELVKLYIAQLKNNFYVDFCNNKATHGTTHVLIVKKRGEVVSGYLSLNSLNFQTKNENKDFSALNNLLSVLYKYSYSK
ncbi:hypothetical protein [Chryseobacterium sp.]|uniref:hypothetical protein n=1 Tax=Chryseobacterium sp. TaxID=1871047 RepID=UPI00289735D5|nr:hypothetical protein [Chryseobacterium sp.]